VAKKKEEPKYVLDPETLTFELQEPPRKDWWSLPLVGILGLVSFVLFMWAAYFWNFSLPKTAILRFQNMEWRTRVDQISQQLDRWEDMVSQLEIRDDRIYRSVYGMDEIPQTVRGSGFGGENRYEDLQGTSLLDLTKRLDVLEKRLFIQSKSFDEVAHLQQNAGDMASHIPAIPPINPDRSTYRLSSTFGYRSDPFTGHSKRHTGMDFACKPGNPIYVTGDGIVTKVVTDRRKGYGFHVEVEHGFGYKTRYAHMSRIDVSVGDHLKRGDCVGLSGNTGRSSGPHLHYEVHYRRDYMNPALYMDLDISPEDYFTMVRKPEQ
jgi:hypothetical protein